jgi:hypothetical protein
MKNSRIAKFSFSLSIISTIVMFLSLIMMTVLMDGSQSEDGSSNVGVVVGLIPSVGLTLIACIGIIVSLLSGIVVLFQKEVIKKYAFYSIGVDCFTVLCLVLFFAIDYLKTVA